MLLLLLMPLQDFSQLVEKVASLAGASFHRETNFMRTVPGEEVQCTHVVCNKNVSPNVRSKVSSPAVADVAFFCRVRV